jgi:hypothetical protein
MTDHDALAEALRTRIGGPAGLTDAGLRQKVAARAAGGPPLEAPFDALACQIGEAASQVTDDQVSAVRQATGSDRAAFEIVMSAAVGAGLRRWDAAIRALKEAPDAPP